MAVENWISLHRLDDLIDRGFEVSRVDWANDPPRAIVTLDVPAGRRVVGARRRDGVLQTICIIHPDDIPA